MTNKKVTALTPPMGTLEKLGFGCFSMSNNVVFQFKSSFYLFFLTNVLGIGMATAGTVLALGTVWDAINDPLLGYTAVNHRFKNGERIRPFILYSVFWALSVVGLFTAFGGSEMVKAAIALVIYFVFEAFNTYVGIPYNGMASVATNRDEERRSINVYRNIGGCFGTAIGTLACNPLLKLFGAMDKQTGNLTDSAARGFLLTACVMAAVIIFGAAVHFLTTKERILPEEEQQTLSFREVVKALLANSHFVKNTLYILCYNVINTLLLSCIVYYATYIMGSTGASTPIQAAYLVMSLGMSFAVSAIDRKLGRRKTMILATFFYVFGKVWFVLQPKSAAAMYVNALTVGVAVSISYVMFNTNRNNIVDLVEAQSGHRLDSMVSTVDNLAAKMGNALVTWLIGVSLDLAGFEETLAVQPEAFETVLTSLLGWVPALVGIAMFFVVRGFRIEDDVKALEQARMAQGE